MNEKYVINILKLLNIIMIEYSHTLFLEDIFWVYSSLTNNNINIQIFINYKQYIKIYDKKKKQLLII